MLPRRVTIIGKPRLTLATGVRDTKPSTFAHVDLESVEEAERIMRLHLADPIKVLQQPIRIDYANNLVRERRKEPDASSLAFHAADRAPRAVSASELPRHEPELQPTYSPFNPRVLVTPDPRAANLAPAHEVPQESESPRYQPAPGPIYSPSHTRAGAFPEHRDPAAARARAQVKYAADRWGQVVQEREEEKRSDEALPSARERRYDW